MTSRPGLSFALIGGLSIAAALALCGCTNSEHIPTYPSMSADKALEILNERSRSIKTMSAQGLITLTRSNGNTIRLDAAIVMRPPYDAHVRAWKFGQMVFDMVLSRDKTWIVTPPGDSRQQILEAGSKTGAFARRWLRLISGNFDEAGVSVSESGSRLLIDQCERDGGMTRCSIDRSTLTPREYVLKDHSGTSRFSLSLRNYGQFNGLVWPQTIEAVSDSGRILIELRDIDINGELPATAFHPAPRAELLQ